MRKVLRRKINTKVNYRESLVTQNTIAGYLVTTPIGSSMSQSEGINEAGSIEVKRMVVLLIKIKMITYLWDSTIALSRKAFTSPL